MSSKNMEDARLLRECAAQLLKLADDLSSPQPDPALESETSAEILRWSWTGSGTTNERNVIDRALSDYRARQRRDRYLPKELFGEPAWDMLLDLFVASLQDRQISVSSACLASGVPTTTALRWLGQLERGGLVERRAIPQDQRVVWVKLSAKGLQAMTAYCREAPRPNGAKSESVDSYVFSR